MKEREGNDDKLYKIKKIPLKLNLQMPFGKGYLKQKKQQSI